MSSNSQPSPFLCYSCRPALWRLVLLVVTVAVIVIDENVVDAKTISGDFKLSGEFSEKLLVSFAVAPNGARMQVNFTTGDVMYENEQALRLHLFRDLEWSKFQKGLTCHDKVLVHQQAHSVVFHYKDRKWKSNPISVELKNARGDDQREAKGLNYRPHYWYVVLDDCSLEYGYQRDGRVPIIHYDLQFMNRMVARSAKGRELHAAASQETHLSADEMGLINTHFFTFFVSGSVALYLFFLVSRTLLTGGKAGTGHSVHAAVLWVLAAAALDGASSLMEIWHLNVYARNGIGLYSADALAAHLEALCDALLVMLLLAIAAGWTLPSDVVLVNPQESIVQKLVTDLAKPLSTKFTGSSIMIITILAFHVILAQWGRTFNDDFESYHDLENLPGRLLMGFRMLCGLLLVICTVQTRNKCKVGHLKSFYAKVTILGLAWLLSLPMLSYSCSIFVPYYLRHPAVYMGAALAQCSSLLLFAWLVTSHSTSYHQFSHMASSTPGSNTNASSLTEVLHTTSPPRKEIGKPSVFADDVEPRTWKLGKAKIRLD